MLEPIIRALGEACKGVKPDVAKYIVIGVCAIAGMGTTVLLVGMLTPGAAERFKTMAEARLGRKVKTPELVNRSRKSLNPVVT